MSVTCRSDCCHRLQFKTRSLYFHHLAGGRVAAVHEEASLPPWRRPWRRWQTPRRRQRRRRWQPSRGGKKERRRKQRGQLLPGTVWQHNDLVCGGGDGVVSNGGRADFCGRPQCGPGENGRTVTWQGDCSVGGNGGSWEHLRTLPPATESVELISDTVGHGETGEVDEVSWTDYILGSDRQIFQNMAVQDPRHNSSPLHGHGVSVFILPEGSVILLWAQDTPSSLSAHTSDKDTGEQYLCGVLLRCPKSKQAGGASQLIDLRVDVGTRVWFFTCHPCDITLPFSSVHQQSY